MGFLLAGCSSSVRSTEGLAVVGVDGGTDAAPRRTPTDAAPDAPRRRKDAAKSGDGATEDGCAPPTPMTALPDAALTPSTCGNGVAEGDESCDGTDLRHQTCGTLKHGVPPSGVLACTAVCTLDTTGCGTDGGASTDSCGVVLDTPPSPDASKCIASIPDRTCGLPPDKVCGYDCLCNRCGTEVLACRANADCAAVLDCFERTGCDVVSCDRATQCGTVIAAKGGGEGPAAALAYAALACNGGVCRPCCPPPATTGDCGNGAGVCLDGSLSTRQFANFAGGCASGNCRDLVLLEHPTCRRRSCGVSGLGACLPTSLTPPILPGLGYIAPSASCAAGEICASCSTTLGCTGMCN